MPPLKQPDTLETLALKAVSEYVHTIGQTVFKAICSKVADSRLTSEEETLEEQKFNLEPISTALYKDMPHVLRFNVATYVLNAINNLITNAQCSLNEGLATGHQRCKDFVEELIVVLITPHVTHMNFIDHVPFSRLFLAKNLDRIRHIKVLRIGGVKSKDIVKKKLAFLTSLTSFTMERQCTDDIIDVLAQNCKKLKILNITGSQGVTDRSARNIKSFQNLQDLQISCTGISVTGVWYILTPSLEISGNFLKDNFNLQALGYNKVWHGQLHMIAHSYLRLTRISLRIGKLCDLKILSQMKHLKEFKVNCGNFIMNNMPGLLEALGHQLEILDIIKMQDVDVGVIATHCVNLNALSLDCYSVEPLPQSPRLLRKSDRGLPFQTLKQLTIHSHIEVLEFILVKCIALRRLRIGQMAGVNDSFISSCLSRNPLKKLELFRVSLDTQISLRSVYLLLKNCPNISCIQGLSFSQHIQPYELSQFYLTIKHNNYAIQAM